MRSLGPSVLLAGIIVLLAGALPASAAPLGTLGATYQASPPASAGAGTTIQLPVTLTNSGTDTWTIVSGQGDYIPDMTGATRPVKTGDVAVARAGEVHGVHNSGELG